MNNQNEQIICQRLSTKTQGSKTHMMHPHIKNIKIMKENVAPNSVSGRPKYHYCSQPNQKLSILIYTNLY